DRVATITIATLRSGPETVGTVPKGNILTVRKVDGGLFWVKWSGGQTLEGWVNRADVVPIARALEVFNDDVKRDPATANYVARGTVQNELKQFDKAIADFTEAIRRDPNNAIAYSRRGRAWASQKEFSKASADFNAAIRIDAANPIPYIGLGWVS